ncbi:hypothetical protein [Mesorhizobium sp. CN2-181]|uniref:hypothetical protein n=1 Tax=Mesorhizobium yinganensis TaxID=3157707 RepID=UPI0032B78457
MINAPRSTTYEMVSSLLEAEMLENVGSEGHVYFGRAMHLFGWADSHHNAHYRRVIETLDALAAEIRDSSGGITQTLCLVLPVDTPEARRNELPSDGVSGHARFRSDESDAAVNEVG